MAAKPDAHLLLSPHNYDRFAHIYNRTMGEDFTHRMMPVIDKLLLCHLSPGAHVLDLCCGTGQMARALTEAGFRVIGVDSCESMLRFARGNAPAADFVQEDAREFHLPDTFDGAISTFNSLAHLVTTEDLQRAFRNVRSSLRHGGSFLFDLSTEEAYASRWRGSFSIVEDECVCVVQPSFDSPRQLGTNRVTMFQLERDGWGRSDFHILQKCHSGTDLRAALAAAGFTEVQTYDAERDLGVAGESGRMVFVCR